MRRAGRWALLAALVLLAGCGGDSDDPHAAREVAQVVAAGDIGRCDSDRDEATAKLVAAVPDATVLVLGDAAYPAGLPEDFRSCYAPSWGAFRDRTRPVPGNHEYDRFRDGARGYFDYFGDAAGPPAGYYSFRLGTWHVIALNSNCEATAVGGCGPDSEQLRWLGDDLRTNRSDCTLAFWHHPRFSSGGRHGSDPRTDALWRALEDAGADVVLSGHEHNYERFAPQTPDGVADADGIRAFVVGTGGAELYSLDAPLATSESQNAESHGVLVLTLRDGDYDWRFEPVEGKGFRDSGSGACR